MFIQIGWFFYELRKTIARTVFQYTVYKGTIEKWIMV